MTSRVTPYHYLSPPYGSYRYRNGRPYDLNSVHTCPSCKALNFKCEKNVEGIYFKCCKGGKTPDPETPDRLPTIKHFITNSPTFLRNINYYNNAFAFASIGFTFKQFQYNGDTPIIFNGQIRHRVGSLASEDSPRYAQLYFLDDVAASADRCRLFSRCDPTVVRRIEEAIRSSNPLTRVFRNLRDVVNGIEAESSFFPDVSFTLIHDSALDDQRRYGRQEPGEVGMLFRTSTGIVTDPTHMVIHTSDDRRACGEMNHDQWIIIPKI